jgi:hypothetical protein
MAFPLLAAVAGAGAIGQGVMGFLGAGRAEKAAKQAAAKAEAAFQGQAERGEGFINTGADRASGFVSPHLTAGTGANKLYADALGVNGADAQRGFYSDFQTDPGFEAEQAAGRQAIEHSRLFQGRGNSGATQKDLHSFGQRSMRNAFSDRLDRLSRLGQQGQAAAGTMAGIETGRGTSLADIALKRGGVGRDTQLQIGQASIDGINGRTAAINSGIKGLTSAVSFGGNRLFN